MEEAPIVFMVTRCLITPIRKAKGKYKARYERLVHFFCGCGDDVQAHHLKHYVAFKRIKNDATFRRKNFACVILRPQKETILVTVQVNLDKVKLGTEFSRPLSGIGHEGTGNVEITLSTDTDLERARPLIQKSYEQA